MGTTYHGFLVHFEKDIGEDGAKFLSDAISAIKYVTKVEPIPTDHETHLTRERVKMELYKKLFGTLYPEKK